MDTEENSTAGRLIADLAEKVETTNNRVSGFPASAEEYMGMELGQRLEIAGRVLVMYANMPAHHSLVSNNGVSVNIPTDKEGVILEGKVGYSDLNWRHGPPEPQLSVWLRAIDSPSGSQTSYKRMPSVILPHQSRERPLAPPTYLDPEYTESIEVIDAAVCQLLAGKIAEQREALGNSALLGALAKPVH